VVVQVKPFTKLAAVYDDLMVDIQYESWIDFMLTVVEKRGLKDRKALELGCGTGNATVVMNSRGFSVTGLDSSPYMLGFARSKLPSLQFVRADFETFVLDERYPFVYSVFDTLNNLLDPSAFRNMAQRVFKHLEASGIFVFDLNTTIGLRELWDGNRIEGSVNGVDYIWEHSFDEANALARIEVSWESNGQKFREVHFERGYDIGEVRNIIHAVGFTNIEVLVYPSARPATGDEPRVWVVAKKGV